MRTLLRKRNKGFTLIELMIVVAIIGILAAIAIPNFLRFQLKAKSSEGKVNVAAIRTAETAYASEYAVYIAAAASPAAMPVGQKEDFVDADAGTPGLGFGVVGWAPEGKVYFQYTTAIDVNSFTAVAEADIDADAAGVIQSWGYVHGPNPVTVAGCADTGVWDAAAQTASILDQVGPCNGTSGQSDF